MVTISGVQTFLWTTVTLKSFPLFLSYLFMICLSRAWQKRTSPIELRKIKVVYNISCSLISLYSMIGLIYGIHQAGSIFAKDRVVLLLPYIHIYWVLKIIELLDTVFMILGHRRRQISFLHVFHHSSMLLLSDISYHVYPWPCIAWYFAVNSFVHVVLYSYYGLTVLYPGKQFTWRRHVTELQLFQFFIGFIHSVFGYLFHGHCVYSIFYGIALTSLFLNFYYHAYIKKSKHVKINEESNNAAVMNGGKPHTS